MMTSEIDNPLVYHITTPPQWSAALSAGELRAPSLESEGFIHFSTAPQVERSLRRFFADASDVVLLEIDAAAVADALRYEPADGQLFPHLYRPLPVSAVTDVRPLTRGEGETWSVSIVERQ